jgi:1-acyl-sn-glycerol-3-phosphate acyltransferase
MSRALKASATYRFAAGFVFGAVRLFRWRITVTGQEHLPKEGGFVLAANHQSAIDAFLLGHAIYRARRQPVYILVKQSLFHLPVIGWVMRKSGNIAVNRSAGADAYAKARQVLQDGGIILVFPEQTISPSFELLAFKAGAVRLAREANVPLVAAASFGSHRFQTLGRRPRPIVGLPVEIAYGPAVSYGADEPTDTVLQRLFSAVATLYDDTIERYPGGLPAGLWWVPARFGGAAPTHDEAIAWREAVLQHIKTGAKRSLKFPKR